RGGGPDESSRPLGLRLGLGWRLDGGRLGLGFEWLQAVLTDGDDQRSRILSAAVRAGALVGG
ncbi:MAG TPA: hypothetical protein QGH10_21820, partial [Armatimonadota bacterium]|nr:hypothetical protein [Armatimonadota bacterium]